MSSLIAIRNINYFLIFFFSFLVIKASYGNEKYNILIINTDDQRAQSVLNMPILQKTAKNRGAWVFKNAFVENPICCPSRASLLTPTLEGETALSNGVYRNDPPNGGPSRFKRDKSIQKIMKQKGYYTIHAGKYFNRWRTVGDVIPPYWDDVYMNFSLTFQPFQILTGNGSDSGLFNYGTLKWIKDVHSSDAIFDKFFTRLQNHIEQDTKPFFAYYSPFLPHLPADLPEEYQPNDHWKLVPEILDTIAKVNERQKPNIIKQLRAVEFLDSKFERLFNLVPENTIIIFTSDNGMMWGELGYYGKAKPFDGSIRVPLIVFDPINQKGGIIEKQVIAHEIIHDVLKRDFDFENHKQSTDIYFHSFYSVDEFGVRAWRAVRSALNDKSYLKLVQWADEELSFLKSKNGVETYTTDSKDFEPLKKKLYQYNVPIILDVRLPNPNFRRRYRHQLSTWAHSFECWHRSGRLPNGVFLRPDCSFGGIALKKGKFRFEVELRSRNNEWESFFKSFEVAVE